MDLSKIENVQGSPEKSVKVENGNRYDLEERTASFAIGGRDFCLKLPKSPANVEYMGQLNSCRKFSGRQLY